MFLRRPFNPVRPGLFSRSPGPARGGGSSDAKNHSYHQPIEVKFCVSHYSHKSMPDAKFESGSFPSFGDLTTQNFPLKKGRNHQILILPPEMSFMSRIVLVDPKLAPMSISAISKQRKFCSFSKFLRHLDEKSTAATLIDQFC